LRLVYAPGTGAYFDVLEPKDVPGSLIDNASKVASAVYHPLENENVRTFDAVEHDVLANGEAARAGAEVFITGASGEREGGKEKEPTRYRVNSGGWRRPCWSFPR